MQRCSNHISRIVALLIVATAFNVCAAAKWRNRDIATFNGVTIATWNGVELASGGGDPENETLAPDEILVQAALSGAVTDIDEDPDSPDANWLVHDGTNSDTDTRVSFGTPTGSPTTGAGLQEFRVQIRKNATGGNSTTWSLQLWEDGSQVAELATGTTTSLTGEVVAGTWDATSLGTVDGSLVECRLQQTGGGSSGSGTNRRRIEIGAVEWNVTYTP